MQSMRDAAGTTNTKKRTAGYCNLRAEMARLGITNEMIAETIGVNPGTFSAKLNQRGRLKLEEAVEIREAYFPELTVDYLFEFQEAPKETA